MHRFDLETDLLKGTGIITGEIYLYNGEWKFSAIGQGFSGSLGNEVECRGGVKLNDLQFTEPKFGFPLQILVTRRKMSEVSLSFCVRVQTFRKRSLNVSKRRILVVLLIFGE